LIEEQGTAELAKLPLLERLSRCIGDSERNGPGGRPRRGDDTEAAAVLFGSGQMQLPFVLPSAEVMKTAVAYLEPHAPR
jgi:5-methyltetrahydrofolate--homocysteine methyltransferase